MFISYSFMEVSIRWDAGDSLPYIRTDSSNLGSEGGLMLKETRNSSRQSLGYYPVGGLAWLVDPRNVDKLVPVGAVGEIVFESYELSAGYLNDPEKTAKTFIHPPVWAHQKDAAVGCKCLRMGDLGRYETDGSVSVYGRADTQVKVCGTLYDRSSQFLIVRCRLMGSASNC